MVGIERDHPGTVALIGIGCGADINPFPRGTLENVEQHGEEITAEVSRLLGGELGALHGKISSKVKDISLPLVPPPSREDLKLMAASDQQNVAYAAKRNLERLGRGEPLARAVPYQVQAWTFGDDLAMVFLPGEVTVDYQLRLKTEFDGAREMGSGNGVRSEMGSGCKSWVRNGVRKWGQGNGVRVQILTECLSSHLPNRPMTK